MTPVEKITAAIKRLEQLKADSTSGEWTHVRYEGVVNSKRRLMAPGEYERPMALGDYLLRADADLIITLHRTIDAQLAILRVAHMDPPPSNDEPGSFENALALARTILGES